MTKKQKNKDSFISIISSMTPEEVAKLILEKSKIKTVNNVVIRINK